jgi:hypothetical protein
VLAKGKKSLRDFLGRANRRVLALASARPLAGSPHAARNPHSPLARAGRGFDSLRLVKVGEKKPPAAVFWNALVEAKGKKSLRDFP